MVRRYNKMRKESTSIGEIDQDHQFLYDNEFIVKGYRRNFSSIGRIFRSLFMCHNESLNVWSHLLGAILFLCLLWYLVAWAGFAPTPHTHDIYESFANSTYVSELKDTFDSLRHMEEKMEERVREVAASFCPNIDNVIADLEALVPAHTMEAFSELKSSFKGRITHFCQEIEAEFDSQYFDFLFEMYNPYKAVMHPSLHADTHVARWPIMVFVFSAFFCLGCSATFHLFSAYSSTINRFMSRLDYAGISLLIAGSSYPLNYYFFYCYEGEI
jgi:adiponectin receptor